MQFTRRGILASAGGLALAGCDDEGSGVVRITGGQAPLDQASVAAAPVIRKMPSVYLRLGGGGFATLAEALASITDASPDKVYRIQAEPNAAGYACRNLFWKDDVELEGLGSSPVLFHCELPAETDPLEVNATQPIHVANRARFINLRIRARNCHYPLSLAGAEVVAEGCMFEHLGNAQARIFQLAAGNDLPDLGSVQLSGAASGARPALERRAAAFL